MINYCSTLTGITGLCIHALPWLLLAAAGLGAIVAAIRRRRKPVESAVAPSWPVSSAP